MLIWLLLYLTFLSSEFIETVLVTFVDIVFVTFVDTPLVTITILSHKITESSTNFLNTYHSHKYMP